MIELHTTEDNSRVPPREALLFGHYHEQKGWCQTSISERVCRLLWEGNPVLPIRVWEDTEGEYWSWWNQDHQTFEYTNRNLNMIKVCFANGLEAEEARGQGKLLRVSVEQRTG